ncbi:MAG: TNT domain-containing protein [Gemmataceae bacterium]|nr:TNT domain-containing protein [Gemmataceae bacterium]
MDRYGKPSGSYAGRPGDPASQRGLPPGSEGRRPYTMYVVIRAIRGVQIGTASPVPAFGAAGGGRQYFFGQSIQSPIDRMSKIHILR